MKKSIKRSGRAARHGRAIAKRKKKAEKKRKLAAIMISRSSGRKEKFDIDRMSQTTSRSGVPFLMARDIAKNVSRQIKSEAKGKSKKTVTAGRVRKIIAGELHDRSKRLASAA